MAAYEACNTRSGASKKSAPLKDKKSKKKRAVKDIEEQEDEVGQLLVAVPDGVWAQSHTALSIAERLLVRVHRCV